MFNKPLAELTYEDLVDLVEVRQEREGHHLDFKGAIGDPPDRARKELAKDVCAFANSGGGMLVIGVDRDRRIVGVESKVNNRDVDEWLNQVLGANIDPAVYYEDARVVAIPGTSKVLVVLRIPESFAKPHMLTEGNTYMVRMNDSSKPAGHSQVRDMFQTAQRRTYEFDNLLERRKLVDEDNVLFCINRNSKRLRSDGTGVLGRREPFVLYSLVPRTPAQHRPLGSYVERKEWLAEHSRGYEPAPGRSLFYMVEAEPLLHGFLMKVSNGTHLSSYFELLDDGCIEVGLSKGIAKWWNDEINGGGLRLSIFLTSIIGYEMMLMRFVRDYYSYIGSGDEVLYQLSFVNMQGAVLTGLNGKFQLRGQNPANTHHPNFMVRDWFVPSRLSDNEIQAMAMNHSEQICRAFGFDQEMAFEQGQLDPRELSHSMI
ncbi:MAG TPA: ATP-binding protein [Flavobacteriales bacterium]|nr:ATP-binding protein [Flavobacteriales bacterium]